MTSKATAELVARVKSQTLTAATAAGEALTALRDAIADLQDRRRELDAQPCSRAEAEERLRFVTRDFGRDAARALLPLLAAAPRYPVEPISAAAAAFRNLPALELVAALQPDALAAWALRELDRQAEALGGWNDLDAAARKAEHDRLARELLALEREEEALIVAAEDAGLSIARRPDADPRAVLGLDDEAPVTAAKAPAMPAAPAKATRRLAAPPALRRITAPDDDL